MATRSTIVVRILQKEIGKEVKFDNKRCGADNEFPSVKLDDRFMEVYHHWDGYPEGLGNFLYHNYKDRESVIELLSCGDVSTIIGGISPYYSEFGDEWERVKPRFSHTIPEATEEYQYLFMGNKWYYRRYEDENFHLLSKVIL